MEIYDKDGQKQSWEWLRQEFGDVRVTGEGQWRVAELRERVGPVSCDVHVRLADGSPATGVMALWSWPDGHHKQMVDRNGYVGFVINAFYRPPAGGPYWLSLLPTEDSQTISGLGMVGRTVHRHLDVVFQRSAEPPVPPPDGYKAKWEQALEALREIKERASREIP